MPMPTRLPRGFQATVSTRSQRANVRARSHFLPNERVFVIDGTPDDVGEIEVRSSADGPSRWILLSALDLPAADAEPQESKPDGDAADVPVSTAADELVSLREFAESLLRALARATGTTPEVVALTHGRPGFLAD